jgi:uncharacterized protein YkwD
MRHLSYSTTLVCLFLASLPASRLAAATFPDEVIRLTNVARAGNGLPALTPHNQLARAAQNHAIDMGENDFFSHTGLDGSTPTSRSAEEGYTGGAGENIAAGQTTPAAVVDGWLNSPGHRANILNADYQAIGVGYHFQSPDGGSLPYEHYWVQVFGLILDGADQGSSGSTGPRLNQPAPVTVQAGDRIRIKVEATARARRFTIRGNQPAGIRIRKNSGLIVGRITQPGNYRFRVLAFAGSEKLKPVRVVIRVR